jgi:tetratricopeptide (TPR) repeat protein
MTSASRCTRFTAFVAVAACFAWAAQPALAADDGGGRSVFAYGAGNRALALGGAFVAIANDASAPLWNPGGLGLMGRTELQATHAGYYDFGIDEQYGSLAYPNWRWGTFSLTLRHFGVDDIEHRDDRNTLVDDGLSNSESEFLFGYGRSIGEAWSVGGALKFRHHSLAGHSGSGVGVDLGVIVHPLYMFTPNSRHRRRFSLGLAIRNAVEPKVQLENEAVPDPTGVRVGAAMYFPVFGERNLLTSFDVEKTRDMNLRYHAGVELFVHHLLAMRVGVNDNVFTSGAAIKWHGVSIDYTYENAELGGVHLIGATFTFGPTVEQSRLAAMEAQEAEMQARLAAAFEDKQEQRVDELLTRASSAERGGRYDEALRLITVARAIDPDNIDAQMREAVCLREYANLQESDGDFASAAVTYSRALAIVPGDAQAKAGYDRCRVASDRQAARSEAIRRQFAAALDAFSEGDLAAASDGFAAILRHSPNDTEAAAMLRRTESAIDNRVNVAVGDANRLIDWGALDEAGAVLSEARSLRPEDTRIRMASSRLEEARASELAKAQASQRELSARPGSAAAGSIGGTEGVAGGKAPPTEEQRREVERLYSRGIEAMTAERNQDAIRYFELAWSIEPDHKDVKEYLKREYLMRGMEYFADGRLNEAVEVWEKALRVDPDDERVNGYLTRAREQIERTRQILGSK